MNDLQKPQLIKLASEPEWRDQHQKKLSDQIISFREKIRGDLTRILYLEILFVCVLLLFQGFGWWGFKLNNWAFGFFINGCLVQTLFLIKHIVINLFPNHYQTTNSK